MESENRFRGPEGDLDHGFQVDRSAVFGAGTEMPLLQSGFSVSIESFIQALQYVNIADAAIAVNDCPQDDCSFNLVAYQGRRVGGIDFADRHGRADAFHSSGRRIQFREAHDPASTG